MTPDFQIVVDEHQNVTRAIRERLLSLRVSDEVGYHSDDVEIRLDDRGGTVELPRRGAELRVELGYSAGGKLIGLEKDSARVLMGRYTVDQVNLSGPPATLTIRAKAADMRGALKEGRTRSWHQVSIGDLVATIAARYGLEPRVTKELARIVLPHVDQIDESDLHLLTRLGEQYDAAAKTANGRLVFARRGLAMSATLGPLEAVRIAREQTSDYRAVLTDRSDYRSVRAYWYDEAAGQRVGVTAGEGKPVHTLRYNYLDEATARAAAQNRLDVLNRGTGKLSLTLKPGVPTISAEKPLILSGFRRGVDGRWITTRVLHEISGSSGYFTQVAAERPTGK